MLIAKIGKNKKQNSDFLSIIKKNNLQKSTYMSGNNIVTAGQLTEKQLAFVEHLVKGKKSDRSGAPSWLRYAETKCVSADRIENSAVIRQARQTLYQTDPANLWDAVASDARPGRASSQGPLPVPRSNYPGISIAAARMARPGR